MWKESKSSLSKTFKFQDFNQAFSWMTRVALYAEKVEHHPDWQNVYNQVKVSLSTHDADNSVTEKDRDMAKAMDAYFKIYE